MAIKKKSRKISKKKSRHTSRFKRVMRGGRDVSYGLMKKYGHTRLGSMRTTERTIYLDIDTKKISWYDESEEKGGLDISDLIELKKTDTTLYIKSVAGNLSLKVDTDEQKKNLQQLYNDLLSIKSQEETRSRLRDTLKAIEKAFKKQKLRKH